MTVKDKILEILESKTEALYTSIELGGFNTDKIREEIADDIMAVILGGSQEVINLTVEVCNKFWLGKINEGWKP